MNNLVRVNGWRTRMQANIDIIKTIPFEWGTHDCALFAGDHVKALTDVDMVSDFRGTYTTAFGAIKALKEHGYDDLLDLCKKNFPEIHISQTRNGDLVVLSSDDIGYALAIVLTGEVIGVLTTNGYGIIRKNDPKVVTGFKIG